MLNKPSVGSVGFFIAIALIATTAAAYVVYSKGYAAGEAKAVAEWEADKAVMAKAVAKLESQYRVKEQKWVKAHTEVVDELRSRIDETMADRDAAVAAVTSESNRLRERFRGCERADTRVPGNTGTVERADERSETGLSGEDQKFLVRIGAEADMCAHRLTALQNYVRRLYENSTE